MTNGTIARCKEDATRTASNVISIKDNMTKATDIICVVDSIPSRAKTLADKLK